MTQFLIFNLSVKIACGVVEIAMIKPCYGLGNCWGLRGPNGLLNIAILAPSLLYPPNMKIDGLDWDQGRRRVVLRLLFFIGHLYIDWFVVSLRLKSKHHLQISRPKPYGQFGVIGASWEVDHTSQFRHHSSASLTVIMWKVVDQHLFINIIPDNVTAGTGRKVWCDRGIMKWDEVELELGRSADVGKSRFPPHSFANKQG